MDCVETMDKKDLMKRLSFLVMSDGCLTMHKGCVNASFAMAVSAKNRDFIEYAARLLDEVGVGYNIVEYAGYKGNKYVRITSRVHPFLTTMYHRIYVDGRKLLDPHAFKLFDWEAFSILYMSDGSCSRDIREKGHNVALNMCRLSYQEQEWLKKQIKEKLGVEWNVCKCGKYWRLCLLRSSQPRFFSEIKPYLLSSFLYKCPDGRPLPEGGDIVRP